MGSLKELELGLGIAFIVTWIFILIMFILTFDCMKSSENTLKEQNQQIIELLQSKE